MANKLYFEQDDDMCYCLADHIDNMEMDELDHLVLFEAKRDIAGDYFFCKYHQEVADKSEGGCGKMCEGYKPINGKSGRCIHSGYCYDHGQERLLLKRIGKKIKLFTFEKYKKAVMKEAKFYPMLANQKEFHEGFLMHAFKQNQSPTDCCNAMTEVV